MYHGDLRLGDTIDIKFTTVQSSGAPTTLAGSPVISAYPGNSTTELTAGITLSVDFDSRTGMHNVRVVATSGNGYATATNYALVITTGTVNSVSAVGYVVGTFSIENRSAVISTTAANKTLTVDSAGSVFTTALTESYNADGAAPTVAQALFLIISFLMEANISSTTLTAKKLDGSTTAATFTLSDATNPVTITRAT